MIREIGRLKWTCCYREELWKSSDGYTRQNSRRLPSGG